MKAQAQLSVYTRCSGGYIEPLQENCTNKSTRKKLQNINKNELRCVCLNARSIIKRKGDLDFMVSDIEPDIIGITESWAHKDMVDAERMLSGYVMFRKDRQERMGGGVIMYIKDSIQAYELQMEKEAECEEGIWCNIATKNSTLTKGLIYRSPNIRQEDVEKLHNAIKEIIKREYVIMGDFNHGHIQWKSLESVGRDDQQFLLLIQDSFLTQHVLEPTRGGNVLDLVFSSQNELVDNVKLCEPKQNLGELFVTPEMISQKVKMMKKTTPKLLKEILNEISIPLANCF